MLATVRTAICALWRPVATNSLKVQEPTFSITKRFESSYRQNSENENELPHKARVGIRRFKQWKLHTGGVLPRPGGEWDDKPLPMPGSFSDPVKRDAWTKKKALFGQNDYIDILGDGSIHPWELIEAPVWVKGFRGNELQRIGRMLSEQGDYLRDNYPSKYHSLVKQMQYCYKRLNQRRHAPHWGGYRRWSRIDKPVM